MFSAYAMFFIVLGLATVTIWGASYALSFVLSQGEYNENDNIVQSVMLGIVSFIVTGLITNYPTTGEFILFLSLTSWSASYGAYCGCFARLNRE